MLKPASLRIDRLSGGSSTQDEAEQRPATVVENSPKTKSRNQRPKNPVMVKRFGTEYDKELTNVLMSPRALAWEMLHLNRDSQENDNDFILKDDDPRLEQPPHKKQWMEIRKDAAKKLEYLGVSATKEFDQPFIPDSKQNYQTDPYSEELDEFFLSERRKQAKLRGDERREKEGRLHPLELIPEEDDELVLEGTLENLQNRRSDSMDMSSREILIGLSESLRLETQVNTTKNIPTANKMLPKSRFSKQKIDSEKSSTVPQHDMAEYGDIAVIIDLAEKVVRTQITMIEMQMVSGGYKLDSSKAPHWMLELIRFHNMRLQSRQDKLDNQGQPTPGQVQISINIKRFYDKASAKILFPNKKDLKLKDRVDDAMSNITIRLDLLRLQWKRLTYLDNKNNPQSEEGSKSDGDHVKKSEITNAIKETPFRYHFENLTALHRSILRLGCKLITEDFLMHPLEQDIETMLQYAIYEFITARHDEDARLRESLMICWEIKIICTKLWNTPDKKNPCSCHSRSHIEAFLLKNGIAYPYPNFIAKKCIRDYPAVNKILKYFKNPRKPPHPLEDIEIDVAQYGDVKNFIPSWMVDRQNLMFALSKELRACVQKNKLCHASDADHAELLMRVVWGRGWDSPGCEHGERYRRYFHEFTGMLSEVNDSKFEERWQDLGKIISEWDVQHANHRREWCRSYLEENEDDDPYGQEGLGSILEKFPYGQEGLGSILEKFAVVDTDKIPVKDERVTHEGRGWRDMKTESMLAEQREYGMQLVPPPIIDIHLQKTRMAKAQREYFAQIHKDMRAAFIERARREEEQRRILTEERESGRQRKRPEHQPGFIGQGILNLLKDDKKKKKK
ncbi:hypothetical protein H072_5351 [Dactylellina haptotyla CBS 200.50]|uniref:Uncharacterized protein n=1 Tax=Dactylellina haptotyla (strain CBS 200.50) TaxID=1284197 RepID=S8BZG0_DACHA|nr:hypothetical protein H072_5351 [Dactylellina haptotyla CBS 200.50]